MSSFDLTVAAQADLKAIARYTKQRWGLPQRNVYLKEIDQVFHALARNPAMGRACDDIRKGYRKFPHGTHIIFYRQLPEQDLLIVRILHEAMDVDSHVAE